MSTISHAPAPVKPTDPVILANYAKLAGVLDRIARPIDAVAGVASTTIAAEQPTCCPDDEREPCVSCRPAAGQAMDLRADFDDPAGDDEAPVAEFEAEDRWSPSESDERDRQAFALEYERRQFEEWVERGEGEEPAWSPGEFQAGLLAIYKEFKASKDRLRVWLADRMIVEVCELASHLDAGSPGDFDDRRATMEDADEYGIQGSA